MNTDAVIYTFIPRDALILYSVFRSGNFNRQVGIADIISFCDYINHDVLTFEELSESLLRLKATGWVEVRRNSVMTTHSFHTWRDEKFHGKRTVSVHRELKEIESYLNSNFSQRAHSPQGQLALPLDQMEFEKTQQRYLSVSGV